MSRRADRGRKQAYRAEIAVLGAWYRDDCKTPRLDPDAFRALHDRAVAWCQENIAAARRLQVPKFVIVDRSNSCYRPAQNDIRYARAGLRSHTTLHEVAHWAVWHVEPGHGQVWREAFAGLIAEFIGPEFAERFLAECRTQPRVAVGDMRRPRRRFAVLRKDPSSVVGFAEATPEQARWVRREGWGTTLRRGGLRLLYAAPGGPAWYKMVELK